MKYLITIVALCTVSFAHTPEANIVKNKGGDLPPVLEDKPLPPFVVWAPLPGVIVPMVAP